MCQAPVAGSDCKTAGCGRAEARGRRLCTGFSCLSSGEHGSGHRRSSLAREASSSSTRRTGFLAAGFFAEAALRFFGGISASCAGFEGAEDGRRGALGRVAAGEAPRRDSSTMSSYE